MVMLEKLEGYSEWINDLEEDMYDGFFDSVDYDNLQEYDNIDDYFDTEEYMTSSLDFISVNDIKASDLNLDTIEIEDLEPLPFDF